MPLCISTSPKKEPHSTQIHEIRETGMARPDREAIYRKHGIPPTPKIAEPVVFTYACSGLALILAGTHILTANIITALMAFAVYLFRRWELNEYYKRYHLRIREASHEYWAELEKWDAGGNQGAGQT